MNKIQILILAAAMGAVVAIILNPSFLEIVIIAAILMIVARLVPAWQSKRKRSA